MATQGAPKLLPFFVGTLLQENWTAKILPIETVVVWFGAHVASSTIIADYSGLELTVSYDGVAEHTATWNAKGQWELS